MNMNTDEKSSWIEDGNIMLQSVETMIDRLIDRLIDFHIFREGCPSALLIYKGPSGVPCKWCNESGSEAHA